MSPFAQTVVRIPLHAAAGPALTAVVHGLVSACTASSRCPALAWEDSWR